MKVPFAVFLLFLMAGSLSCAEEINSLQPMIDKALKENPELLAAKRSYEAASARILPAASLSDPMVEFEYDKIYADRELSGNPMKTYAISQDVPFPTKLFLRGKIAAKMAKMAYENYKAKERGVIAEIKSAYSELFRIHRSIEVVNENKSILEQFSRSVTMRYSTAQGSQADALKAQVELANVENELIRLEQERLVAQGKVNILMNRSPQEEIPELSPEEPVGELPDLMELGAAAGKNNPELKLYRYAIERGKAAYDLALNEFMPDFTFKFKQMIQRDRVDKNAWAGMIGATIPLWFFQNEFFGVKEMKSELEAVKAEYKMKENAVLFDVMDARARADANVKMIRLYETSFIPQANQTVEAALRGYESGKSDFLTLLDSQRMLIEFKLDRYKAILELRIALADLERAIGTDLGESEERLK